MSEKIIKNWLDLAEYDLESAKVLLNGKRFLTMAFSCQQAIEKILKAIYVKEKSITPPYTHNLIKILSELSINEKIDDKKNNFIENLNSYYLETRYTEEIDNINKILNQEKSKIIFDDTKDLFEWLKNLI
jgi:HEPN domain-containing protein